MTTRSGGDDRTNRKSTGLSDGQVVGDLDKIIGGIHMKVCVKVWCRFVTTRQIESRPDFQMVRSWET